MDARAIHERPVNARAVDVLGVRVSHPDKALWLDDGITKLELVHYYERLAPVVLRYVADRPLTLRPFPNGVDHPGFYLKNAPKGTPPWVKTFSDVAETTGEPVRFVIANDARTLVWMAQYNAVELHPWLSRTDRPDFPDWAVFDLDAHGAGAATHWPRMAVGAQALRRRLEALGLRSFLKLSGQGGLHVLLPLARVHTFDAVRDFCQRVAHDACAEQPDVLTVDYVKSDRAGRILVDYAQNARGKSTVAPYSVRPRRGAPVSMPITWDELADPQFRADRWTIRTAFDRLDQAGDVLGPSLRLRQRLPARSE